VPPNPPSLNPTQETAPPQAGPPSAGEASLVQHYLAVRDRIHEGPFYTLLNDGMKNGLKRKAGETAPTEASLFNPFIDNQTYSSKYLKKRRKLPKLDLRPYAVQFFPSELHATIGATGTLDSTKKRTLVVDNKAREDTLKKKLEAYSRRIEETQAREEDEDEEEEEEVEGEEKEDAGDDEDNWSAVSSDSEESGDDYNAEQYFDNGEDDDAEDDTYDNAYDL
jgi:DNA-directed RNA polymerase III subunit RPC7